MNTRCCKSKEKEQKKIYREIKLIDQNHYKRGYLYDFITLFYF
jgi:hypothetical protein